jgi:hypothetical protein
VDRIDSQSVEVPSRDGILRPCRVEIVCIDPVISRATLASAGAQRYGVV